MKKLLIILILVLLCNVLRAADSYVQNGATDQSFYMVMYDRNGDPNTSITVTTLDMYYVTDQNTVATKIDCTDLGSENAAHSDGGAYEMGTSGLYRFDFPDAAFRHGVGKRVNLWIDDAVTGTRTAYLCVQLCPPVDIQAISGQTDTDADLDDLLENGWDDSNNVLASNAKEISSSGTTADNFQTMTANLLTVFSTDFSTNYNTTTKMFNVDVNYVKSDTPADANILDTIESTISGVDSNLADLSADWADGGRLDLLIDKIVMSVLLNQTTIATLASQTSFTLTDGSVYDDAYNDMPIIIQNADDPNQVAVGTVKDYTGSTKTVELREDPDIFTMAVDDKAIVLPIKHIRGIIGRKGGKVD